MILDAVRESGGVVLAAPEADIPKWMRLACSQEGIALCPETAVCYGALEALIQRGTIKKEDRILVFNTSTAFSPTDVPVLARWGKVLMMLQSIISLTVLVLLAARAVNIL